MKLIIYTNYGIQGSIKRHTVEVEATYFSVNKNELYIYKQNKGFYRLDINKIYQFSILSRGYYNYITLSEGEFVDILSVETTKKELLELLKRW